MSTGGSKLSLHLLARLECGNPSLTRNRRVSLRRASIVACRVQVFEE